MVERHLGRIQRQTGYTCFMQLNNKSILVQAKAQPPTRQVPPQSLFPVPKAPAIGFAGSAPKAGACPSPRETNTVNSAKQRL